MAEKSRGETLRGIRDIYESYESLILINPKQDPGFLIQHLAKVFDKEKNICASVKEEIDAKKDLLDSIQTVYTVFRTLCKWDLDGAPAVLIQSLGEILSRVEEEPKLSDVKMESSPKEVKSDLNIKVVMAQSLSAENDDAPQCGEVNEKSDRDETSIPKASLYLKVDAEEKQQLEQKSLVVEVKSTRFCYKCSTCSQVFQYRTEWKNHRRLHKTKQEKKDFFHCKFCKKSFPHRSVQSIHQDFCSKSPLNKNHKHSSIQLAKRYRQSTINQQSTATSSTTSTTINSPINELPILNHHSNSTSSPVNDGSEAMSIKIRQLISTATTNTIIYCGLNPSSFPKHGKYPCHFCHGRDFTSLERLANHIRTHVQEPEYPYKCLHPKCQGQFKDSSNFRKHLKYPHKENGAFTIPRVQLNIPHLKSQIPRTQIIKKKFKMKRKPLKTRRRTKKKYICVYCDRELCSNPSLNRHIRAIHTGECPFACLKCPSKFTRKDKLIRHEQIFHQADKSALKNIASVGQNSSSGSPYSEKIQETQVNMLPATGWSSDKEEEMHEENLMNNNDNDKIDQDGGFDAEDFETEINKLNSNDDQPRNFQSPFSSSSHQLLLNGSPLAPNTYSCVQCPRKFLNRGHFMSHARGHAKKDEMKYPLSCLVCKLQFHNMEVRLNHEKMVHIKNGFYRCEICGSGFLKSCSFTAHRNFMHSC